MSDDDDDRGSSFSEFSEFMTFKLGRDINSIPDPLKASVIEQTIDAGTFLMNSLENEGKLIEMLTWSSERIKAYENAILEKRKAEMGDD